MVTIINNTTRKITIPVRDLSKKRNKTNHIIEATEAILIDLGTLYSFENTR